MQKDKKLGVTRKNKTGEYFREQNKTISKFHKDHGE